MVMVCTDSIKQYNKDGSFHSDGFYMHSTLKDNIDYEYMRILKNWDCVGLLTGEEGGGKTNLGKAICYYVASKSGHKFTVNDIIFTNDQFTEWLDKAPVGAAALWDEFVLMGLSTDALTAIQNTLIKKMTMIRKKRLFILLVIPHIFMLRKYFAIARTRFLVNVTSPDNLTRGTFDYYSKPNKRHLYILGYKFWEYNVWSCDFHGNFSDYYGTLIDEEAYENKKDNATKMLDKDTSIKGDKTLTRLATGLYNMKLAGLTEDLMATLFGISQSYVHNIIEEFQQTNPEYKPKDEYKVKVIGKVLQQREDFITKKDTTLPMPKKVTAWQAKKMIGAMQEIDQA